MKAKRILSMLLASMMVMSMATVSVSADDCGTTHTATEWSSDANNHWQECTNDGANEGTCGAKFNEGTHAGGTATCEEAAVCSTCKESYGEPLGHKYGYEETGTVTKEATCSEKGEIQFTCENDECNEILVEEIPINENAHDYSVDVEGKPATCTEDGYTAHKKCSRCESVDGKDTILATHHFSEYEWINDTQHHRYCDFCGEEEDGSVADCTYDGDKCTRCGRTDPTKCEHGEDVTWWYVPNDNGTHDVICDTCGKTTEENVKCVYGNDDECDDCGYEKPTSSSGSSSSSSSSGTSTTTKITNAKAGEEVKVKISEGSRVSKSYLQSALSSKAVIVADYGDYVWEISDVKNVSGSVDLSIDTDAADMVDNDALRKIEGDNSNIIDIKHNGELGFKGTLIYNVNKSNAGKFVNLYYYNPKTEKLELQGSTKIANDGSVKLPFTHCSTYVLNITDKAVSETLFEDLAAGEAETTVEATLPAVTTTTAVTTSAGAAATDAAANPSTGNPAVALAVIPTVILAAAVISKKR